jgi:hypothetical protein
MSLSQENRKIYKGISLYKHHKKLDTFTSALTKKEISMNVQALRKVRKLFCVNGVPAHIQRHNCKQWVKSIRFLGDKWLLATPVTKS